MIYQTLLRHRELPVTPMIPRFSRASIPSQTVMPCNQILTILSVGPNHLGSYLISPSVNTSVSPAKNHLYSPPILSTKRLWNLAIQGKTLLCRVSSNLTSDKQVTESQQTPRLLCVELLHYIFLSSGAFSATQPKHGRHNPLAY